MVIGVRMVIGGRMADCGFLLFEAPPTCSQENLRLPSGPHAARPETVTCC